MFSRGVYLPQLDVHQLQFRSESASKDEQAELRKKWRAVEEELFFIPMPVQKDFVSETFFIASEIAFCRKTC